MQIDFNINTITITLNVQQMPTKNINKIRIISFIKENFEI